MSEFTSENEAFERARRLPCTDPSESEGSPRNARFWIFWNGGRVKLTLRPGESLVYGRNERHEEGFSGESERVTHEGDSVTREWERYGRDCDGSHSEGACDVAMLDRLACVRWTDPLDSLAPLPPALGFYPAWNESKPVRVRDAFAESAGY